MPSFTSHIPNLQSVGPVVDIRIAVGTALEAALRTAGTSIPPPVPALAMSDTGATGSVMQHGLAAQLGLNPIGVTSITTPSSTNVACDEYLVRLIFPNNVLFETTVLEVPHI